MGESKQALQEGDGTRPSEKSTLVNRNRCYAHLLRKIHSNDLSKLSGSADDPNSYRGKCETALKELYKSEFTLQEQNDEIAEQGGQLSDANKKRQEQIDKLNELQAEAIRKLEEAKQEPRNEEAINECTEILALIKFEKQYLVQMRHEIEETTKNQQELFEEHCQDMSELYDKWRITPRPEGPSGSQADFDKSFTNYFTGICKEISEGFKAVTKKYEDTVQNLKNKVSGFFTSLLSSKERIEQIETRLDKVEPRPQSVHSTTSDLR